MIDTHDEPNNSNTINKVVRAAMNIAAGAIPVAGGVFSAASAAWSEHEQDMVNEFLKYRQQMLENEVKEQVQTIREVMLRLDKLGIDVSERIKSSEFQSLFQRCLRNWSDTNSKPKREFVRNILVNAASTKITDDDVVKLFIDWISLYSDFHFKVIACIYRHNNGISRGQIWGNIGKGKVREDSADADLYKLLIRDLSTGGIIRQYRQTDYEGNYLQKTLSRKQSHSTHKTIESAFDMTKPYILTELGQQFIHYAMSDVPTKIEHSTESMS